MCLLLQIQYTANSLHILRFVATKRRFFAGFNFVRCIYAFLVCFSNEILISVGLVSSKKTNRQTKRLEDVFKCDISTAAITIPIGVAEKTASGWINYFLKGQWTHAVKISHVNTSLSCFVYLFGFPDETRPTKVYPQCCNNWTKLRKLPKKILAVVSSARCKVFPSITSFRFYRRFQISDFILVSDICTHLYSVTSITSVIIASMGVVPLWQSFDLFIQTGNMTVSLTMRTFQGLYCQNLIYCPKGAS